MKPEGNNKIAKLKRIIENNDTKGGRIFDLFIQSLIIISLIAFSIDTLPDLSIKFKSALKITEIVTVTIFTIEYLLRIFSSLTKNQASSLAFWE